MSFERTLYKGLHFASDMFFRQTYVVLDVFSSTFSVCSSEISNISNVCSKPFNKCPHDWETQKNRVLSGPSPLVVGANPTLDVNTIVSAKALIIILPNSICSLSSYRQNNRKILSYRQVQFFALLQSKERN